MGDSFHGVGSLIHKPVTNENELRCVSRMILAIEQTQQNFEQLAQGSNEALRAE
jgi:hypothetical protein